MAKYLCLIPCSCDGSFFVVGGDEVCRITRRSYLPGTPKEDVGTWATEWFYIADVPLEGLIQQGLPHFPICRQKSNTTCDQGVIPNMKILKLFIWPLKSLASTTTSFHHQRDGCGYWSRRPTASTMYHMLWRYNGSDDATRFIR